MVEEQQTLHAIDTCCCVWCEDWRREHDPVLVDVDFAQSVGAEETDGIGTLWRVSEIAYFRIHGEGQMVFKIYGDCEIECPTIGQFYTACRLYGVELKERE